jgi:hypothetical protein
MLKLKLPEVPPPGAGLNTVTATVRALESSSGKIAALSCELPT